MKRRTSEDSDRRRSPATARRIAPAVLAEHGRPIGVGSVDGGAGGAATSVGRLTGAAGPRPPATPRAERICGTIRYTSPQPSVITKSPGAGDLGDAVGGGLPVRARSDVAGRAKRLRDELAGDAGDRILAGAVDVEHDRVVGVALEHLGELAAPSPACASRGAAGAPR